MRKILAVTLLVSILLNICVLPPVSAADASDIVVDQEYDIDVVLSVGNSNTNINSFNNDLKAALIAKGVPEKRIKISSVQATTTSTDSVTAGAIVSGWLARPIGVNTTSGTKDTDYSARYAVDAVRNRIYSTVVSDRPAAVYFNPNGFNTRNAVIEYTWGIVDAWADIGAGSGSFAHGEAGFIFRMDPTRDSFYTYTLDNHAACGNLAGFGGDGIAAEGILKFTNGSNNPSAKSPLPAQTAGTNMYSTNAAINPVAMKLNDFAVYALGRKEYVKIELNGDNIKVYRRKNNSSGSNPAALDPEDPYALIFDWTDTSSPLLSGTYGFYVWDQDGAYFSNITLTTESTRNFSEIIREPEWRSSSKRFIVNLENNPVADFSNSEKLGEILSRMGNEDIHYIGWGTNANQADAQSFISKNDNKGTFTLNTNYNQSIGEMADYIYSVYSSSKTNSVIYMDKDRPQQLTVAPASEKYDTTDAQWPQGKWKVLHDDAHFENGEGKAPFHNQYLDDLDVIFDKPGKYEVYYKDVKVKTVYAHRRPIASFSVSLDGDRNVTITDNSYDLDHMTQANKGIVDARYRWKESTSNLWTAGTPSALAVDKDFIIEQQVRDAEGEWSIPYSRYVSTNSSSATLKAVPEFRMLKDSIFKNPGTAVIEDLSYSPSGSITAREWTVQKNGITIYTDSANPKTDFSSDAPGVYKIRLRVQNANGWSDYFSRYLTVVDSLQADKDALEIGYAPGDNASSVTRNVTLPLSGTNGSAVTWASGSPGTIDTFGNVFRPSPAAGDSTVVLTATLRKGLYTATKTFTLIVKPQPASDAEAVALDKANLAIGYAPGDNANSVTQNVTLPALASNGSNVSWTSDTAGTVANNGTVTRPANGEGDKNVKLTATLTKNGVTETRVFKLVVKEQPLSDAASVAADKAALAIGYAVGDSQSYVTRNVSLPSTASNGSTVTWSSDIPAVVASAGAITTSGAVTRPTSDYAGNTVVTLTATIQKGAVSDTKVFSLTVIKDPADDEAAVAGDKSALQIIYAPGDDASSVTQNVTLPVMMGNGSSVSWSSDNAAVSNSGTVTRPATTSSDAAVNLTATITKNGQSETKQFTLLVKKQAAPNPSDAADAAAAKAALEIAYAAGDNQNSVTQNVGLPVTGENGTTVSWSSNFPGAIDALGNVFRPSPLSADKTVVLTATITKNGATETKTFTLLVKALQESDEAIVAYDKKVLEIGYAAGDNVNSITKNLTLPTTAQKSSAVTWQSSDTTVIAADGKVTRPAAGSQDKVITLTATITKGAAQETKKFILVVKAQGSAPSGGNDGTSSTQGTQAQKTGVNVIVNGVVETAATETRNDKGGKIEVAVDVNEETVGRKIDAVLAAAKPGQKADNYVRVPVNTAGASDVDVSLNGQIIKKMEDNNFKLDVNAKGVSYVIPASEFRIGDIAKSLKHEGDLKQIEISVNMQSISGSLEAQLKKNASTGNYQIMLPAVNFEITAKSSITGKTASVQEFSGYVQRVFEIPQGIDSNKITTGVVVDADGTVRHMPTYIALKDGKYYAHINSLSNSPYTVIWNPMEFNDAKGHWAQKAINDMGSRMVVNGYPDGEYKPGRNMTRAEFAAIVVKALGLKPGSGNAVYSDVAATEWYDAQIRTATRYGIIEGYGNGKFGPMDEITREQAMTMLTRAMKITGLKAELAQGEADELLAKFSDSPDAFSYARPTIAACLKTGIAMGRPNGIIAPKDYITRAEVATIVRNLLVKSELIDNR